MKNGHRSAERALQGVVTWAAAAFTAGVTIATFIPSALNWGFHFPAFLPAPVGFIVPFVMAALLLPPVQKSLLFRLEVLVRVLPAGRNRKSVVWVVTFLFLGACFWIFRQEAFLLGDGALATRNLSQLFGGASLPSEFRHSPLPAFLDFHASHLLTATFSTRNTHTAFQAVSVLVGILSVTVAYRIARIIVRDSVDRLLAVLLLTTGGTAQFFFGYVEMYPPAFLLLLVFLWLGLEFLRGTVRLWVPLAAYALLVASHFEMLWFFPAAGYLFLISVQRQQWKQAVFGPLIMSGLFIVTLLLTGYAPGAFVRAVLAEGEGSLLPLTTPGDFWRAYPLLSLWHGLDLLNLAFLVMPLTLPLLISGSVVKPTSLKDHALAFSAIASGAGLLFVALANLKIGMSRDWDVAALNAGAVGPAALIMLRRVVENRELRRRIMLVAVALTMPVTASWIMVNASQPRAMARQQVLIDERLWSAGARAYALDEIGGLRRDAGDLEGSLQAYASSLALDTTSVRRWVALGSELERQGRNREAGRAFERAVALGTNQPWVYANLGAEYIAQRRFPEALRVLKAGLELDHELPLAAYNIGTILSTEAEDYEQALEYFLLAIHTDPGHAQAYRNAGSCLYYLGRLEEMREYYQAFLSLAPDDSAAADVRTHLETLR